MIKYVPKPFALLQYTLFGTLALAGIGLGLTSIGDLVSNPIMKLSLYLSGTIILGLTVYICIRLLLAILESEK